MGELLQNVKAMFEGPGHLRFIIQPAVAILLGLRDGRIDSHAGRRPVDLDLHSKHGREYWAALSKTLRRIVVPLCLAIILSLVFQYVIHKVSRLLPAVTFATFLVALPYLIARGIGNRMDTWWHHSHPRKQST
jgi:hypothetical protein